MIRGEQDRRGQAAETAHACGTASSATRRRTRSLSPLRRARPGPRTRAAALGPRRRSLRRFRLRRAAGPRRQQPATSRRLKRFLAQGVVHAPLEGGHARDRDPRIDGAGRGPERCGNRAGGCARAPDQLEGRRGHLREGHIEAVHVDLVQRHFLDVLRDADDGQASGTARPWHPRAGDELNRAADRILAGEEPAGDDLVDDRDPRRAVRVGGREGAPGDQRDGERSKIVRAGRS